MNRERKSKRKREEKIRDKERSTQFRVGSINGQSNRGRFGLTQKFDELL